MLTVTPRLPNFMSLLWGFDRKNSNRHIFKVELNAENVELTCRKAALASNASADSAAMETRAVGVPVVGVAAGERRGVEVRENSSGGVPWDQTTRSFDTLLEQ